MTKQTIIDALIKGGMTQADAEAAYAASIPTVKTDAELMRENEMLKAKVTKLEGFLSQAIDVANKANDQAKAKEEAEIADLIDRIKVDSNNKWNPENLKGKSLADLRLIKTTLDVSREDTFAGVAALQAEKDKKPQPFLTVGAWDAKTGTWKGGIS